MVLFNHGNRMAPLWELRREMDNILNRFPSGFERGLFPRTRGFPAVNVWEDAECFCVEAEIPGVNMDDVEINGAGNELTIKGRREPLDAEDLTYHRQERGFGEFTRVVTFPADMDTDKVEATLKNGVLTITLPKAQAAKTRRIAVKSG